MSTQVHIGKGAQRILDMAVAEFRMGRHAGDALTSLQNDPQRAMQGLKQTMDRHETEYKHTDF